MKSKFLGVLLFALFLIILINPIVAHGQSNQIQLEQTATQTPQVNILDTPTVIPSTVPTIQTPLVATPDSVCCSTTNQIIDLYKEAVDVSKNTVEEVHSTANLVLTVVGVVFTALGLAVAMVTWSIGNTLTKSADQLEKSRDQLIKTQSNFEEKAKELEKKLAEAVNMSFTQLGQRQIELEKKQMEIAARQNVWSQQIEETRVFLMDLEKGFNQIKSETQQDRQVLKKPLILVQIDEYGMQALSEKPTERSGAIMALIEITHRDDAIVRRGAVKALGLLDEYNDHIAKRLNEIIKSDSVPGVRKEAEKSLKLIEAKKPKKTMRRKP